MNRRKFIGAAAASIAALNLSRKELTYGEESPELAITMDDFNLFDTPVLSAAERNRRILDALSAHSNLKAAIFVAGKYIDTETKRDYLRAWNDASHLIGNHSYSHFYYPGNTFEIFSCDFLRGEAVIRDFRQFKKIFRFPYLKEGETEQKRDRMRQFIKANGYRNGHVTIDASDWYVDGRLLARLKKEPNADLAPYRKFYLEHLWDRANYYNTLARKVVGRPVKHTILLHHNVINGLFLKDVLQMFADKGWRLIDAETAFADPIFSSEPKVVPAGESLVWSLAKETGRFEKELRYPGEDGDYEKAKMDQLGL